MTDDDRQRILDEAYATIARVDAATRDLEERRVVNLLHVDPDADRARLERLRRTLPPKAERGLDTRPPDLDERIAAAVLAERATVLEIVGQTLGEMLGEQHQIAKAELSDEVKRLRLELSNLETTITELRGIIANEAQRSSATVIDLPSFRYPRELN
jgi:hypothetical protein